MRKNKLKNIEQANIMLEQSYLKSKGLLNENEQQKLIDDRIDRLKTFFQGSGTGREKGWVRNIYKHFKDGGEIDNLEQSLKNVYSNSPGIFNFSKFNKEEFMTMIEKLGDSTFLEEPEYE